MNGKKTVRQFTPLFIQLTINSIFYVTLTLNPVINKSDWQKQEICMFPINIHKCRWHIFILHLASFGTVIDSNSCEICEALGLTSLPLQWWVKHKDVHTLPSLLLLLLRAMLLRLHKEGCCARQKLTQCRLHHHCVSHLLKCTPRKSGRTVENAQVP